MLWKKIYQELKKKKLIWFTIYEELPMKKRGKIKKLKRLKQKVLKIKVTVKLLVQLLLDYKLNWTAKKMTRNYLGYKKQN